MARFSKLVSREAPVRLAHALWVVAGLLVAGAAVVLMIYLSTVSDSTRAASDLAELRTYAKDVALGADLAHHEGDTSALEGSIEEAEEQTRELAEYVGRVLGEEETELLLTEVKDSWADTAAVARAFAASDGEGDFSVVVESADATGEAVDELLAMLTERSELRTDQFRRVLRGGTLLLVVGMLALGSVALRQRRRVREVDALTGVFSRDRFLGLLAIELLGQRPGDSLAVAVVDIDRFRRINQTLGAEQGDRVLRDVARRIQDTLPRNACVGRRGGDEFLRTQAVNATASANFSDGVWKPSVCRGRPFSSSATASSCSWVTWARLVPFGKYWRSSPLVFSFEPRCHGLLGSQT